MFSSVNRAKIMWPMTNTFQAMKKWKQLKRRKNIKKEREKMFLAWRGSNRFSGYHSWKRKIRDKIIANQYKKCKKWFVLPRGYRWDEFFFFWCQSNSIKIQTMYKPLQNNCIDDQNILRNQEISRNSLDRGLKSCTRLFALWYTVNQNSRLSATFQSKLI